jgi:hypothetical protein
MFASAFQAKENSEERGVSLSAPIQEPEQEEEREREERTPLVLHVRNLRDAPGHEGVNDAGQQRGGRIPGDVAGEGPGCQRGQEHASRKRTL